MKTPNETLPNLPSKLLAEAISAFELVMLDPRYIVDMACWHDLDDNEEVVHVCFGGAVLAKTLNAPLDFDSGQFFNEDTPLIVQIDALDSFRQGCVKLGLNSLSDLGGEWVSRYKNLDRKALNELGGEGFTALMTSEQAIDIALYEDSPKQFLEDMDDLRKMLEKHGL